MSECQRDYKVIKSNARSCRFYFYDGNGIYANINIDPEIIRRLQVTEEDNAIQSIITTPEGLGILILPKRSKNRSAGSGYQASPADDSTDSGLDYQYEHD